MRRIGVLGVPSSAGARQKGQEKAPQALRKASLLEKIRLTGLEVLDFGDLPEVSYRPDKDNPKSQNLELVVQVAKKVSGRVNRIIQEGSLPLVLGGDCTITVGVLDAIIRNSPNLGLVYFDGDIDMNIPDTTISGIFDGMGLAHIIGKGVKLLSHVGTRFPLVPEKNIVLFGYNQEAGSIDAWETGVLSNCQMAKYPLSRIKGIAKDSAKKVVHQLENEVDSILVHFDVDVIDFDDFPAADVPHHKGLSFDETIEALTVFITSKKFVGLVVTEFNVNRDNEGLLAKRLVDGVGKALRGGPGLIA